MDHKDLLLAKLERSARSVARLSAATKVVSAAMLFIAGVLFLFALSRLGRSSDDFVGFSLLAVATAALAFVFWGGASFHAAFGQSLGILTELHLNIETLVRLQQREPHKPSKRGAAPAAPVEVPSVAQAAPLAAVAAASTAEPAQASLVASPQPAPNPPAQPASADAEPPRPARAASDEEVAVKACRHCGGAMRFDASRCRHCLGKV